MIPMSEDEEAFRPRRDQLQASWSQLVASETLGLVKRREAL